MRKSAVGGAAGGAQLASGNIGSGAGGQNNAKGMDEKSKKDMTGFFQGLINKGNSKKITERKNAVTGVPPMGSSTGP